MIPSKAGQAGVAAGEIDRAGLAEWTEKASRFLLSVVAVAALVLGIGLWIGASQTSSFFAWTILSPTAASALGGFYIGIGTYAVLAAATRRWAWRRVVFPPAIAGPAMLLIPTALHQSLFNFHHAVAWLWLILYIVFPPVLLVVHLAGLRSHLSSSAAEGDVPGWQHVVLLAAALLLGGIGLALLVNPTAFAPVWAWPLTPLIGQVYGCWLIAGGIGLAAIGLERQRSTVRFGMQAVLPISIACGIGPLLHPVQLTMNGVGITWFCGWAAIALLAGSLLWLDRI